MLRMSSNKCSEGGTRGIRSLCRVSDARAPSEGSTGTTCDNVPKSRSEGACALAGMVGVSPPQGEATLLVIKRAISPPCIVECARAHEAAGYDMVLVGTGRPRASWRRCMRRRGPSGCPAWSRAGRLRAALFARKVATFD